MAPAVATYEPRDPSHTELYKVIADHLETFLTSLDADPDAKGLPAYVQREFYTYLQCGILAHGFLRMGCDTCQKEVLVAFSCKRRGFCPSCAGRRMAQTAAHLVECVIPWVPTRQWVVSVPVPLRYWMAASQDLTAKVHTIIRTTIGQYYVNQAVTRGVPRDQVQPGSISIAPTRASSPAFSRATRPARPMWQTCFRKSAIGSSVSSASWGTSKRVATRRWRQAMTPWWRTHPRSLVPWRPLCSNAWLLGSGPGSTCAASARGLATRGNTPP